MTTSAPSPPNDSPQMELGLMFCAADSLVRTSAQPEPARALRVNAPAYGVNMLASFASFDPASSSWKTSQLSLVADLETYSETWPRSGTMRGGIAFQLPPLAPLTRETASGLLPTPEASNTKALAMRSAGRSPRNFLKPLPPSIWATPTAHPRTHTPRKVHHGQQLANQVGGSLNPMWIEWLMGFPLGWTACMVSAMPSSQKFRAASAKQS